MSWTSVTDAADILIITSTDGGLSFGSPVEVTTNADSNARSSAVAVFGNNVYVTWQDFTTSQSTLDPEIFFAVSTDGGASFSTPINISNIPGRLSKDVAIAASEGNVYVVWTECATTGLDCRIFFTKSTDNGITFSNPAVALSNSPESSLPDVAVIGNTVYVVYGQSFTVEGSSIVRDVFLLTSPDGGTTFGQPINLSNSPGEPSANPNIDVSGNNVVVTWEERVPTAATPHWEVLFIGSIDGGASFSTPISLSNSLAPLDSTLSDIAVSGNNLYSTWTAFVNGNSDIFFASGTLTPPDTTIPQINSAAIAPTTLGPGESNIAIELTATDNVGIQYAQAQIFDRNTGGSVYQSDVIPMQLVEGNAQTGRWTGTFAFPSDLPDGQYIVRVLVSDGLMERSQIMIILRLV